MPSGRRGSGAAVGAEDGSGFGGSAAEALGLAMGHRLAVLLVAGVGAAGAVLAVAVVVGMGSARVGGG
jgi:hypothetical protein